LTDLQRHDNDLLDARDDAEDEDGNDEHIFVEKYSFDMSPPTSALSSRVLACHRRIRQLLAALRVSEDEE